MQDYATRSGKARVTAAVRLETFSRLVDVFQVGAHGSLGYAQAAGDLGVGVPGGDQAQQVFLPGGELGDRVAAAFGVEVGLVQVRAQQHQQRAVTLGEVRPGPADKFSRTVRPGPGLARGGSGRHSWSPCSSPCGR